MKRTLISSGSSFEAELAIPARWLQKYFGDVRPVAMMISAGLLDTRMLIEIEVTAIRRQGNADVCRVSAA